MENEKITNNQENVNKTLGVLERIAQFIKNYGFKGLFSTILTLFLTVIVTNLAFNPNALKEFLSRIDNIKTEQHDAAIAKRMDLDPYIRTLLVELKSHTDCDRAFILETHNGSSNLYSLPFIYFDMTYEEVGDTMEHVINDYQNVRMSRYPYINKIYSETYIIFSIDEVKPIDEELYYRLRNDKAYYVALMVLYGDKLPIGALGIEFSENNKPDEIMIRRQMQIYGGDLIRLLDNRAR